MNVSLRWLGPGLVFLTTQLVYLPTLNPAFPNDDSAETITAGATLGLQHPPGYALAALWDRLFSFFPLGGTAFRVNWSASLAASLGAALLTWILLSLFETGLFLSSRRARPWVWAGGAALGGWGLAFSPVYWQNALSAKGGVYHLSLCLQLAIFLLILNGLKKETPASDKSFLGVWFLAGVGLAGHWETFVLIVPAALVWGIGSVRIRPTGWIKAGCSFLIGLSPLLYLPFRARLGPALNLGDPQTLSTFWADLTRSYFSYREMNLFQALRGEPGSAWEKVFGDQAGFLGSHLAHNLGLFWGFLAFLGMVLWFLTAGQKRAWFGGVFSGSLLAAVFLFLTPQSGNGKFLLSLSALAFLWAAAGLMWVATETKLPQGTLFMAMAAVILLLDTGASYPKEDQSRIFAVQDYGENLLKSLPRGSLFFAESDEDYFSLYYLQQVERLRPDVVMIPAFTLFESWGTAQVEREHLELGLTASVVSFPDHFARIIYATSELAVKNKNLRPVAFSNFNGAFHSYYLDRQKNIKIRSSGLVWLLDSPIARKASVLTSAQMRVREIQDVPHWMDESLAGIRKVYGLAGLLL